MKKATKKTTNNDGFCESEAYYSYLVDMIGEMNVMAKSLKADVLSHILEVALLEAKVQRKLERKRFES